jgi:hypothetical protein
MGLTVIATDMNSDAVGFQYADYTEVRSTRDVEGTVEVAKRYDKIVGIDGVMT